VFTCHPYFARETAEHLDAERLDLTALRSDDRSMTGPQVPTVESSAEAT
jgi:hypothetical protein